MPGTLRRWLPALAAAMLALGAVLPMAAGAAGAASAADPAPAPSLTVSPASNLVDGQTVTMTWRDVPLSAPDDPSQNAVDLRQCSGPERPTSVAQCSTRQLQIATGSAGSDTFLLKAGPQGNGVVCDVGHPCTLVVTPDEASRDFSKAAVARIDFAADVSGCPDAQRLVSTLGTDAVARAFRGWQTAVCQAPLLAPVDFTASNDVEGRQNLVRGSRDIAVSEVPLTSQQQATATAEDKSFGYAPVSLSGVVFAYNLRDTRTGQRITDLKMTPKQLALAFTGQISNWNEAGISTTNGDRRSLPAGLKVVARADSCATTLAMTSFFLSAERSTYEAGGSAFKGGATNSFPSTGTVDLRTGGAAVANAVARPAAADYTTSGFLGVLDASVAALNGLPTIRIVRGTGADTDPAVAATPQSLLAGYPTMTQSADGTRFPAPFDSASSDTTAYPIPTVTYAVVPTSGVDAFTQKTLRDFLGYVVGDGQDTQLPEGYVALPAAARQQARDTIGRIVLTPSAPAPTGTGLPGPTAAAGAAGVAASGPGARTSSAPASPSRSKTSPMRVPTPGGTVAPTPTAASPRSPVNTSAVPPVADSVLQPPSTETLPVADPALAGSGAPAAAGAAAPAALLAAPSATVVPASFASTGGGAAALVLPVLLLALLAGGLLVPRLLRSRP